MKTFDPRVIPKFRRGGLYYLTDSDDIFSDGRVVVWRKTQSGSLPETFSEMCYLPKNSVVMYLKPGSAHRVYAFHESGIIQVDKYDLSVKPKL